MTRMARILGIPLLLVASLTALADAQSSAGRAISGAWVPMGGGRGAAADPKIAPPPATPIVLKPAYAKMFDARRAADAEATKRGDAPATPAVLCLPYGMPRMMTVASYPIEILQTPGQITIVTEAFSEVRRVFLDQPQLPIDEVPPGFYGHSVGRWDGDTLVVESTHFRDGGWLDVNGAPLTSDGKITERFRRPTVGTLEIDVTIDDPKAYTRPWTVRVNQRLLPDADLIEFVCLENNQFDPTTGSRRPR